MLKQITSEGPTKLVNIVTPDVVLCKDVLSNLDEIKYSLNNKLNKVSLKTNELYEYECLVTSKLEATVNLSIGSIDDEGIIEEEKHLPECIDVVDGLSEVIVEDASYDEDISGIVLKCDLDEEDSYSGEEVEVYLDEEDDLYSNEDDFDSDIYDDADHDSDSDYSDIISRHSNSDDKTESCNGSLDSFEELTFCENCF